MSLTSYRDQEAAGVGQEMADLKRSFVVRQGKCLPVSFDKLLIDGDLSQNIYLEPDDFIYFPSAAARDVYVLGAVTEPRMVPYHEGLTVAGAVAGHGAERMRAAGIEVTLGVCQAEARRLNEGFARWSQHKRPFVLMKVAMTLDGRIAPPSGQHALREPYWITCEAARAAE